MHDDSFEPILQVSEYNEVLNNHVSLLGEVIIEGELSRLEIKNGRLIFGSIKDSHSTLDFFSMTHLIPNPRLYEPGMLVHLTGTAGFYKQSTKFRLMVNKIEPVGVGSLQIAFDKLKLKLEVEGLFDSHRKRPIPPWPQQIGLITAENSSAYFDMVKILSNRSSGLDIKLLPVNVQGKDAIPSILTALKYCQQHSDEFDLIIIGRGGGSLEDLQAFNNELIVRSVFALHIPVISAIGHEDNWSLTDYVADLRASTPSNAAELAVRDKQDVLFEINANKEYIYQQLNLILERQRRTLLMCENELISIIHDIASRTRELTSKMTLLSSKLYLKKDNYSQLFIHQLETLKRHITTKINTNKQSLDAANHLIHSLNPITVLNRGYSITRVEVSGQIIKDSHQLRDGEFLRTTLALGEIISKYQLNKGKHG